jgi:hypothetical protein
MADPMNQNPATVKDEKKINLLSFEYPAKKLLIMSWGVGRNPNNTFLFMWG